MHYRHISFSNNHSKVCCVFTVFLDTNELMFFEMKSSFILLLTGFFLGIVAAKATRTDTNKLVDDGKIVLHQIFNAGTANAEILSLRKEVEILRKKITQLLEKNETKGKERTFILSIYM